MIKKILYLLIATITITSCEQKTELPERIKLTTGWTLTQDSNGNIVSDSLKIPTTVQSDLMDAGVIPDPFKGNNEEKVAWVAAENWTYSTSFNLKKEQLEKDHVYLNFDGLNTYASVFLNDSLIHKNDNAFVKSRIYVKGILKETNILKVAFKHTTPFEKAGNKAHLYTLPLTTKEDNHRVFTRKGQFEYGWDWGPVLNTMGFSRPVYLDSYNGLKIKDVYLEQQVLTDSIASLTAQIELEDLSAYEELYFKIHVNDSLASTVNYKGKNTGAAKFNLPFDIKNPQRWWPHNLGQPHLYDVKITATQDGIERDSWSFKKGLRTVELVSDIDSIGQSFYFKINDVPVYAKGANYIPQNSMQNLVKDQDYESLLSDAVAANMNFIRVWGGGNYEEDVFYEKCDEKGLMVWQDFMFACAMYPGDIRFRESVKEEATQQVKRLRNHSSIAVFNGNNEVNEAWHNWGWQQDRSEEEKEYIWNEYQAIFTGILPAAVEKYSDVPYWESSPLFGRGNEKFETHGNAHDWWVWHSAYPFEHFEEHVPRFSSEFGFQSHPSYEAIRYINENDSLDIHSTDYATHQKHPRGNALIREYMERDFPVPTSDDDYVYVSQLLQAYGISKAMNAQRRERPRSMGTIYWQLNDCWPVVSWSSIDYFGNWKALHYQAKRDFDNILISNYIKDNVLHSYIINDNLYDIQSDYVIQIKSFAGTILYEEAFLGMAGMNSSAQFHHLDLTTLDIDPTKVYVKTSFESNEVIDFLVNPKSLQLPQGDIKLIANKTEKGHSITLSTEVFQKDVFLFTEKSKGHFTDNFFDMEAGETKTIVFETEEDFIKFKWKTLNEVMNKEQEPLSP